MRECKSVYGGRDSPGYTRSKAAQTLPEPGRHFISSKYNWERLNHCVEKSYKNIKYTLCENICYECVPCIWLYVLYEWEARILPGLLIHICIIFAAIPQYFTRRNKHPNIIYLWIPNRSGIAPRSPGNLRFEIKITFKLDIATNCRERRKT